MDLLKEILTYRRPAGSRAERNFIRRHIAPTGAQADSFGNRILTIPMPDGSLPPVLWSAHTDTVHRVGGRQNVQKHKGILSLAPGEMSDCLGADCGTGSYILLRLAAHGVPGVYVWHRAEESGCLGSRWIAQNTPQLAESIRYAIAFDRRDFNSIVTHQLGRRTASDAFARGLADILGAYVDTGWEPDSTGIYTDTVEYTALVPECTNVSMGYGNGHSAREWQDARFPDELVAALVAAYHAGDLFNLPAERDPNASFYLGWVTEEEEAAQNVQEEYYPALTRGECAWCWDDIECGDPVVYIGGAAVVCRNCAEEEAELADWPHEMALVAGEDYI